MRELNARRRYDSAKHYLELDASGSALHTTLTLAAHALDCPDAMLSVFDAAGQTIIVSARGGGPQRLHAETPCHSIVRTGEHIAVDDLRASSFASLPFVRSSGLRAYVGVPVMGREGLIVGTLCVADVRPHQVGADDVRRLCRFASVIEEQLDLLRRQGRPLGSARELIHAIDTAQITPWFQPIVELDREQVVGYEALARWQHPVRGLLQPEDFIPLAEDSELIVELDLAVLYQAAGLLDTWRQTDPVVSVSVNLSARHFAYDGCVDRLAEAVDSAGVIPEAVVLELTETSAFAANPRNCGSLQALRDHGFRILLDDFGTGWSSLDHLTRLPSDGVKIDHSTSSMLGTRVGDAVVAAVAGLARELGKSVVIEGIESPAQAAAARDLGCTHAQGYLWSAPMHADAVLL